MSLRMEGKLRDRTVAHLAELILAGRWQVGEYLPPEAELVQELGISRTAFREALSQLEARGLVEVRQGIGTCVAERSREAVAGSLALMLRRSHAASTDLLATRRILETEGAALAAERARPEAIKALEKAFAAMRDSLHSPETYPEADLEFHLRLARASENAVLAAVVESLRLALRESIAGTLDDRGGIEQGLAEHQEILSAVQRHDAAAAREAMSRHFDTTEKVLRLKGTHGSDAVDGPRSAGTSPPPARRHRRSAAVREPRDKARTSVRPSS